MEWKEKYEQALKRAKAMIKVAEDRDIAENYVSTIFPELKECKESEDEKIKDVAIEFVRQNKSFNYRLGISKEEVIAWLEKQGEQKPTIIIPKFRVGDEIKTSNEESLTITKIDEKGYWSEDLFICGFDGADKWELVEQKPAWSEEDEKMLDEIKVAINSYYAPWLTETEKKISWIKNKLKSLRPQNWTKEDKERYISCLQRLSTGNPEQPETINSKWFKEHVYPQATWKPSDEQMNNN